jgi:hypothetical protein
MAGLPQFGPDGKPLFGPLGRPMICESSDCNCPPFECVCTNAEGVTVGEWDDTDANPCNIVNCILDTYIWLLEIEIAWRDPETAGDCTIVDGAFVITPDNSNEAPPARAGGPRLYLKFISEGSVCCESAGVAVYATPFNQFGHNCQFNCNSLVIEFACDESGDVTVCATLRDRIQLGVCNDADWWRVCSAPTTITTLAPGFTFPLILDGGISYPQEVVSGSLTLLGQMCGGDYDGDGAPDSPDEHCPTICAPSLDFEITEIGHCVYSVTNLTVPGGCPIKLYVWSDGYSSELPERPNITTNTGCGESDPDYRLTLWVIDEADCLHERSEQFPPCCRCEDSEGNPCSTPSGLLTATLIEDCVYLLQASAPPGEFACSTTSVIEWRLANSSCNSGTPCDCTEIEAGNCGGVGCSSVMGDGDSFLLTITEGTILEWRARETNCCVGEWNEIPLPCFNCECCDKTVLKMYVTVAGWTEAEFGECDGCPLANGTYELTTTDGCFWTVTAEDVVFPCNCNPTLPQNCSRDVQIFATISCDGSNLYINGSVTSDAVVGFEKIVPVVGDGPWDCSLLEGGMTITSAIDSSCSVGGASISIDMEFSAA